MSPAAKSFRTGLIVGLLLAALGQFFSWYGAQAAGVAFQLNVVAFIILGLGGGLIGMAAGWLRRRSRG